MDELQNMRPEEVSNNQGRSDDEKHKMPDLRCLSSHQMVGNKELVGSRAGSNTIEILSVAVGLLR